MSRVLCFFFFIRGFRCVKKKMTDTCNHKVALDMMPKSMSRQKTGKRSEEPSPKQPVPLQMPNSHGIQALDMNVLRGSNRVGIIGLPGMGKSSPCRTLLRHLYSSFPVVCVCSGSESENPFYSKFVPRLYIHSGHPATDTFGTIDPFDFFFCVCQIALINTEKMSSILFVQSSDLGSGCNPCRNIKMDWRGVVTLHMRHKNMNINVDIVCKKLFQQAIDLPVLQKKKSGLSGQYDRIILHKCQDATMEKLLWLLTPDAPVVIMIGKRDVTIPENMASHYLDGYNYIFPKEYSSHCAVTSELSKIAIGLLREDEEEGSKSSPKTNQLRNRDTHSFLSWVHDSSTKDQ